MYRSEKLDLQMEYSVKFVFVLLDVRCWMAQYEYKKSERENKRRLGKEKRSI